MVPIDCICLQKKALNLFQFIYTCTLYRKDIGLQFGSNGLVFCACTTDKICNGCQRSQCLNDIFDTSYLFECNLDKHGIPKQGNINILHALPY